MPLTGELNEYGVLKAERQRKVEGGAGLDKTADFDDYTIYDSGELNEYGVLKMERLVPNYTDRILQLGGTSYNLELGVLAENIKTTGGYI